MIFSLPFTHYLLGIILTLFTTAIAIIAGLASSKKRSSARLNLLASLIGLFFFEFSAIYLHATSGSNGILWLYQILAFLFLLAVFFSARTYRRRYGDE